MPSFPKNSLSVPNEIERIRRLFAGRLDQDVYIVGNGPSSGEVRLSEEQINNSVIFRANWFFLEVEKRYGRRVDGFFWSVDNAGLREQVEAVQRLHQYDIEAFFQPFHASDVREKVVTRSAAAMMPNFDHWAVIASNPTLARFMMGRPLPTQGMQMIAFAAILGFKRIHVSGIDLYADVAKRYAWDVPAAVKAHLKEKDVAGGYEEKHSLDLDLHFLRATRSQYSFELIGVSHMEILSPLIDRKEDRISELAPPPSGGVGNNIYATLADGPYVMGCMALARSMAKVTQSKLLVMHTDPHVPRLLGHLPNVVTLRVDPIDNPHAHGQERFAGTFTKLRIFELLQYARITFIDADCVMLKSLDDLFSMDGFYAAPDWGTEFSPGFNSGVFSFSPSEDLRRRVFNAIPDSPSDDGGDQGFLNAVFQAEVEWLPLEYNMLKRLPVHHPNLANVNDARIIHFVGDKPWDTLQFRAEYAPLENIWASFLEKDDWRHIFWLNKVSGARRWKRRNSVKKKTISPEFAARLVAYDPVRRHVVKLGDQFLPPSIAKPLDKVLKRLRIL